MKQSVGGRYGAGTAACGRGGRAQPADQHSLHFLQRRDVFAGARMAGKEIVHVAPVQRVDDEHKRCRECPLGLFVDGASSGMCNLFHGRGKVGAPFSARLDKIRACSYMEQAFSYRRGFMKKRLSEAAKRALAEAEERRKADYGEQQREEAEYNGRKGPDPVRYSDWENKGIASDF